MNRFYKILEHLLDLLMFYELLSLLHQHIQMDFK